MPGSVSCTEDNSQITFRELDDSNLTAFKLLHKIIFPIKYSDKFYRDCQSGKHLTQLAFEGAALLGAIACRREPQADGYAKVYILTLGVYSAHRGQQIGTVLLRRMLETAQQDAKILEAYLHVHVDNEEAIRFYLNRGFQKREVVEFYYRRLSPPHAVLLHKLLKEAPPQSLAVSP